MRSRMFVLTTLLMLIGFSATNCVDAQNNQDVRGSRPNIIFILADDMGWNQPGFNRSLKVGKNSPTPNMDKMAGESVRLTILRQNDSQGMDTLEMDAGIRDFGVMQESENDSKVNGPRNVRLTGFDRAIQHDTVLDPDECGGPILDTAGNVVGLNIARAGRVVSYALPSSLLTPIINGMLEEARSALARRAPTWRSLSVWVGCRDIWRWMT